MAQKTTSEAFAGVFNEGMDKFVQQLVNAYQTEYQIKQQAQAQALEQQRYEQARQDQMEREQRQEQREQASFVKDLLLSQQETLAQQMQNVTDPAMRARIGGTVDTISQTLMQGAAGPEALLQAYQQQQETTMRQPSQQQTINPRQPDWVPTGEVPLAPQGIQANVKAPMSPMALAGQAGQQAQTEERRRVELKEQKVQEQREQERLQDFYAQQVVEVSRTLREGGMTPEYRQMIAETFQDVDPALLPPGATQMLQSLGLATDERVQKLEEDRVKLSGLSVKEAEQAVADKAWDSVTEQLSYATEFGLGFGAMSDEAREELRVSLQASGETINGKPIETNEDLRKWMGKRRGEWREVQQLGDKQQALAVEAQQVQIKRGNQEFERTADIMDREEWQFGRDKITATQQDELFERGKTEFGWTEADREAQQESFFIDAIANARVHGTPEVLEFYLNSYGDRKSETGKRLRRALGDEGEAFLQRALEDSKEMMELQVDNVKLDNNTRKLAYQEGKLSLSTAQYLNPYQREAMRLTYQRDGEQAKADIQNMAFNTEVDNITALSQLAQVVPPESWDNLPPQVTSVIEGLGMSAESFKGISESYDSLRDQPLRQEAMRKFEWLATSDPRSDADKAAAVVSGREYLVAAGIEDEGIQNGMLAVLQANWGDNANSRWLQHQNYLLAKAASTRADNEATRRAEAGNAPAGPTEAQIEELNKVNNANNTAIDNAGNALDRAGNALQLGGCATIYENKSMMRLIPRASNANKEYAGGTCAEGIADWMDQHEVYQQRVSGSIDTVRAMASSIGYELPEGSVRQPIVDDEPIVDVELTEEMEGWLDEAAALGALDPDELTPRQQQRAAQLVDALRTKDLEDDEINALISGRQ